MVASRHSCLSVERLLEKKQKLKEAAKKRRLMIRKREEKEAWRLMKKYQKEEARRDWETFTCRCKYKDVEEKSGVGMSLTEAGRGTPTSPQLTGEIKSCKVTCQVRSAVVQDSDDDDYENEVHEEHVAAKSSIKKPMGDGEHCCCRCKRRLTSACCDR